MKYIIDNYLDLGEKESEIYFNLESIIRYIYCQIPLDYNKMNEIYKDVQVDYCFDYIRNNYIYGEPKFISNEMEDNKYIYKFKYELKEICFLEEDNNIELIREIHQYLTEKSPKNLILKDIHTIKLINDDGNNEEKGGVRNLDWKLHFWPEYIISSEDDLKLHDLIIAAYKIKSHKFETWFEMFSKINSNDSIIWCFSKNKNKCKEITVVLDFDHGC
ncbi:hypothetical protein ma859 [Moumouvirus australiensis]|uniref:Uncharacterized protein n=1 Tax=Moumouvirus australiensis TaxID=2109587 RepID=A0A2P1EMW1_9VIRU|nr:hypothetical protein QKC55_gp045 [Moumouvirus australiensis]AVL95246.1 hypothetical protein ma859 [Moumouvirus australiensis]